MTANWVKPSRNITTISEKSLTDSHLQTVEDICKAWNMFRVL